MNSFYWLDPSWEKATCAHCGQNIWDSGGDPDHGLCHECWWNQHRKNVEHREREYEMRKEQQP